MSDNTTALFGSETHTNWVRLRTLTLLRWSAIIGQITAIAIATSFFDLAFHVGWVCFVIGLSVAANLIAMVIFPPNKRLTEAQAAFMLFFDIAQLGALLALSGGLSNPFGLLLIAPVTISAAALHLRTTIALGSAVVITTTLLVWFHIPLQTKTGEVIGMPDLFIFGFWLAILIGTVFTGVYARRITTEIHTMSEALLATQMALAREQKLTDLSGVIAATAHELGTPLATIKLTSSELLEDLSALPELREDAALIRTQADRCHDILRSMGRIGKDDEQVKSAPLSAVLEEAAEPHMDRGALVQFDIKGAPKSQPTILRKPEIIHGLRNLIQNGVDFANETVWIEARWDANYINVRVMDDGPGYPTDVLGRIGDPFMRRRRSDPPSLRRSEYEGMGLGLFIAKTLLERSGAEIRFSNAGDPKLTKNPYLRSYGAVAEVCWPIAKTRATDQP